MAVKASASGVSVGTSDTTVLSAEMDGRYTLVVYVKNTGATAFNSGKVQSSPDGTNWINEDTATFASLGAGAIKRLNIQAPTQFVQLIATVAAGTTTADCWFVTGLQSV